MEGILILPQVCMRSNSFIVLDGAGGEAGERAYDNIVADPAVMNDCVGANGAVIADNGVAGYLDIGMDHGIPPYAHFLLYESGFRINETDTVCHQSTVLLML